METLIRSDLRPDLINVEDRQPEREALIMFSEW